MTVSQDLSKAVSQDLSEAVSQDLSEAVSQDFSDAVSSIGIPNSSTKRTPPCLMLFVWIFLVRPYFMFILAVKFWLSSLLYSSVCHFVLLCVVHT